MANFLFSNIFPSIRPRSESKTEYIRKYPVHVSVVAGNVSRLEFFLDSGTSPNLLDDQGNSLLSKAFFTNNTKVAYLLLLYGADPLIPNEEKGSDFEIAMLMDLKEMIEMMLISGIDLNTFKNRRHLLGTVLSTVGNNKGNSILELLLALNYNLSRFIVKGSTPLHFAAPANNVDAAAILLLNGADPNCRDALGNTVTEIMSPTHKESFQKMLEDNFPFSLKRLCLFRIRLMDLRENFLLKQERFMLEKKERTSSIISLD